MKRLHFLPGIFAVASITMWAAARTPRMATIREQDGTLRPVWGIAANLITGDSLPVGIVQTAAFSDSAGIVLSGGAVRLLTLDGAELGTYPTSEANPVLGISGPANTAVAWLPADSKLVRWDGSRFLAIKLDAAAIGGAVADIYLRDDTHAELLVRTAGMSMTRAHVLLGQGRVLDGAPAPVINGNTIQLGSALLFKDASGLEIESPNGSMKTLPMREADLTYERAGANCVHLLSASDGRQWLLYVGGPEPVLSEIAPVLQLTRNASGGAK